jgi:hypothetical protein
MDRRDLETAAARYSYLRGLLFIPLGGLFILSALGNAEVGPLRHTWAFLLAALALGALYLAISRSYNARYGRLTPSTRQQLRAGVAVAVGVALMLGARRCCAATPPGRSTSRSTRSPSASRS